MDSYFELKALPNPEIIQSAVVAELMQVLHKLLPSCDGRVGLDFPAYGQQHTLGGIIRLLAARQDAETLHRALAQHPAIQDYALLTAVHEVPERVSKHACYQRHQARGNSRFQRMKKRHQLRGTWTDELEQALQLRLSEPVHLPHVKLKSASTSQSFLLFIDRISRSKPQAGEFNGYGLGLEGTTVPVF